MKTKSILSKLKKTGLEIQTANNQIVVKNGNTILSFWDQDGRVVCLKTKPADNYGDTNPFNSNCYNFFHSSMKDAVAKLVSDWHGRIKEENKNVKLPVLAGKDLI